LIFVIEKLTS